MNIWHWLDEKIGRVEKILVVTLLTTMILVAFFQIVLRNFFATGLSWGDSVVRYLVVWVGFIGAAIATRESKHITIDVVSRWLTGSGSMAIHSLSQLLSTLICGILTVAAIKFIRFEAQMGTTVFFNFPVWVPELIIPVTFGLMTLRFAGKFFCEITTILTRRRANPQGLSQKSKDTEIK